MRFLTALVLALALFGSAGAEEKARERRLRNPDELRGLGDQRRMCVENGVILHMTPAERADYEQKRTARQEAFRRYDERTREAQKARGERAGWKLAAIGAGFVLGILSAIVGACRSRK